MGLPAAANQKIFDCLPLGERFWGPPLLNVRLSNQEHFAQIQSLHTAFQGIHLSKYFVQNTRLEILIHQTSRQFQKSHLKIFAQKR